MKIEVKETTVVKPSPENPRNRMWISNADDDFLENFHMRTHTFYRPAAADFFNTAVLKAALARTLSDFYPIAGRLSKDDNGRVEIDCNGEGAVFLEAEADGAIDDLGDFRPDPRPDSGLAPQVDYSQALSLFPLLLVQVTRFKCGGVCFGVTMAHKVQDGISAYHLLTTWADIARGGGGDMKPYLDRRVLAARNPPQPKFDHLEFQPPPLLKHSNYNVSETKFSMLKLSREQLNTLKHKCKEQDQEDDANMPLSYTSFETITGHAWKCICKARGLEKDEESRLIIMVNGRTRLRPPLPPGYYGNVIFKAAGVASCGEIESNPLKFAVGKVREMVGRMDDEYLRSAIDYLEVRGGVGPEMRGTIIHKSPNMGITSWARLPLYDLDFGWGKPFYVGLAFVPVDGHLILLPSPVTDGSLSLAIALPEDQMKLFHNCFYHI